MTNKADFLNHYPHLSVAPVADIGVWRHTIPRAGCSVVGSILRSTVLSASIQAVVHLIELLLRNTRCVGG